MTPGSDDNLRDLQRRLADAQRRLDRVPARWAHPAPTSTLITILGGNLLGTYGPIPTKIVGLRSNDYTPITSILPAERTLSDPKITDTGIEEAYQRGLCWGQIAGSPTIVWVANIFKDSLNVTHKDVVSGITVPKGAQIWCRRYVSVPASDNPALSLRVWLTWRV